jgi:hypothetical protein
MSNIKHTLYPIIAIALLTQAGPTLAQTPTQKMSLWDAMPLIEQEWERILPGSTGAERREYIIGETLNRAEEAGHPTGRSPDRPATAQDMERLHEKASPELKKELEATGYTAEEAAEKFNALSNQEKQEATAEINAAMGE